VEYYPDMSGFMRFTRGAQSFSWRTACKA